MVEGGSLMPYELAIHLSKMGVEVEVLTYNFDVSKGVFINKFKKEENFNNLKIKRYTPMILKIFNPEPFSFKLLYDFYKKALRTDIVHLFNFYHFPTLVPLILICRIIKKPIIFTPATIHECIRLLKEKRRYFLLVPILFLIRKLVKNLVVTTKTHIKFLRKLGFTKNNLYIVPCGIEVSRFRCNIQRKNPNLLLSVGRFEWNKGQDILLKAFRRVVTKRPEAKLIIAGHITNYNIFKEVLLLKGKLNLNKNVKVLPDISNKKLVNLYKKSSIFILSSIIEDFGIVNLEAMAAGLPVIASDVGGVSSVVQNKKTGFLFESGNVEKLSNLILKLLEDYKLRERMAKNSIKYVRRFDWKLVSKKMVKTYQSVIQEIL